MGLQKQPQHHSIKRKSIIQLLIGFSFLSVRYYCLSEDFCSTVQTNKKKVFGYIKSLIFKSSWQWQPLNPMFLFLGLQSRLGLTQSTKMTSIWLDLSAASGQFSSVKLRVALICSILLELKLLQDSHGTWGLLRCISGIVRDCFRRT